MIKDSGQRTEFPTGAVRDLREGKGRCDILPLKIISNLTNDQDILINILTYQNSGDIDCLYDAAEQFIEDAFPDACTAMLELAIHFEEGGKKYGNNNWQKGISTHCYIDSTLRHYFKWLRGDTDEPHHRAVLWNLVCCIWTIENMPELNDFVNNEVILKNDNN